MSEHSGIASDLSLLTDALAEPDVDLTAELALLASHAAGAIDSYLGLAVVIDQERRPVRLTLPAVPDTSAVVRASLCFPVPGRVGEPSTVSLTLFARTPGAFVDLAADLAYMFGLDPDLVVVDGHLGTAPWQQQDARSMADQSVINQAVGALIAGGEDPEAAHARLIASAATARTTVARAAAQLLASLVGDPVPPGYDPRVENQPVRTDP